MNCPINFNYTGNRCHNIDTCIELTCISIQLTSFVNNYIPHDWQCNLSNVMFCPHFLNNDINKL
jgi:hypothetical protein